MYFALAYNSNEDKEKGIKLLKFNAPKRFFNIPKSFCVVPKWFWENFFGLCDGLLRHLFHYLHAFVEVIIFFECL